MARRPSKRRPDGPPASRPSEPGTERREKKKGGGLALLAWAGAGFAAAHLIRRLMDGDSGFSNAFPSRRRAQRSVEPTRSISAGGVQQSKVVDPPVGDSPDAEAAASLELPEAAELMWIPGPSGPLRVAQQNADATVPLIFVHGLGGSLHQWAPVFRRLGPALRAVALDLPGHGESDPASEATVRALSGSILAVANALKLRRFVLVAHDTGAAAAIALAAETRSRVAGLLLVDPNGDQSRLAEEERRHVIDSLTEDAHAELGWHFRQVVGEASEEVVRAILNQLEKTPAEVLISTLEASFAYSPVEDLKRFEGPVRSILSPMNDMPFSLHRLLPRSKVAILPDAGHWLMMEHPDAVVDLLEPLLDACHDRLDSVH